MMLSYFMSSEYDVDDEVETTSFWKIFILTNQKGDGCRGEPRRSTNTFPFNVRRCAGKNICKKVQFVPVSVCNERFVLFVCSIVITKKVAAT